MTKVVKFIREQIKEAHGQLEATMADVTDQVAHFLPQGEAHPVGASYAHVVIGEDMAVQMLLQGSPMLINSEFSTTHGLSEMMPMPGPEWVKLPQWNKTVKVDLHQLRQYAQAVYKKTDEYLSSLTDEDLDRPVDLTNYGLGQVTVGWVISRLVIAHIDNLCGEISAAKGLQGLKGYPF